MSWPHLKRHRRTHVVHAKRHGAFWLVYTRGLNAVGRLRRISHDCAFAFADVPRTALLIHASWLVSRRFLLAQFQANCCLFPRTLRDVSVRCIHLFCTLYIQPERLEPLATNTCRRSNRYFTHAPLSSVLIELPIPFCCLQNYPHCGITNLLFCACLTDIVLYLFFFNKTNFTGGLRLCF